jgi:hypothetical protein
VFAASYGLNVNRIATMLRTFITLFAVAVLACGNDQSAPTETDTDIPTDTTPVELPQGVPSWYSVFGNGVTITRDGNYVVITSKGVPDHKSPYFATSDAKYEAYTGTNPAFVLNPNRIATQNLVFRIPITPAPLTTPSPTPLGPIGVAINGVAIFNQYAAGRQPLTGEINSFDQYNGHPQQMGQYHYHVEPLWLTRASREALVGVLLDGYPVYGPIENGQTVLTSTLDGAHGHFAITREFPQGIYHYHTTSDAPYINGSGFYGSPGTVTQ